MRILVILGISFLLFLSLASTVLAGIEPVPWHVSIPANVEWFNSGVSLISGQAFSIMASGSWSSDSWTGGASGMGSVVGAPFIMPNVSAYSLIGMMVNEGTHPPFYVGPSYDGTASATGTLYLSMNDIPGMFRDNSGSLTATIRVQQPLPPSSVPGLSFWGIMAMTLLLGNGMVWLIRRKQILRGIH